MHGKAEKEPITSETQGRVSSGVNMDQQMHKEETLRWISEMAVRKLRAAWRHGRSSVIH